MVALTGIKSQRLKAMPTRDMQKNDVLCIDLYLANVYYVSAVD